jgi:hypothetical protein
MKSVFVLLIAGVLLLTACGLSLWRGKTIGLYGVIEPRTSVFYWLIVLFYGVLGILCVIFVVRLLLR